jgi:hypothetical protein
MHASSLENMFRCYEQFVGDGLIESRGGITVLDVGGANVNGSYREIFDHPKVRYVAADLADGNGVDLVLSDPYHLPMPDNSVDVVISGQMLEHCDFFWLTFAEMVRVSKVDGVIILIAPSSGPIHRYPVDCYRFYPDAYRALAKHAGCHLLEVWLDERGPWRDLVGVFSKSALLEHQKSRLPSQSQHRHQHRPTHLDGAIPIGSPDEEATRGRMKYLEALQHIHRTLQPQSYLEIGVRHGRSLALADCPAVGVDLAPEITEKLGKNVRVCETSSDAFFASELAKADPIRPDLVFIDGMHLFEYVLRDFMHAERLASPSTLIVIDDVFPNHPTQALRKRASQVWTGDVWKLYGCLQEARPDLVLVALDTQPTGMLLVAALDPSNRKLWDDYNPLVARFSKSTAAPPDTILKRRGAYAPDHPHVTDILKQLKRARDRRLSVDQIKSILMNLP